MLRQRGQSAIKVIDFGSSCYEHQKGISVSILTKLLISAQQFFCCHFLSLTHIFLFSNFNQSAEFFVSTNQSQLVMRCWQVARSVSELIFVFFFFLAVYTYIQSRFYRSPEVILGKLEMFFVDPFNLRVFATFQTTRVSCFQVRP